MKARALFVACILLASCARTVELTADQKAKLAPRLQMVAAGETPPGMGARRPDGVDEYEVIIRGSSADDVRAAGVKVQSVTGEIMTARVTRDQIRTLVGVASIRYIEVGSVNTIH